MPYPNPIPPGTLVIPGGSGNFTATNAVNSPSFNPKNISGLTSWYDPSDTSTLILVGNLVTTLKDKSDNQNDLTQATVSAQPTLTANTFNSKPGITFTKSSSQFLASLNPSGIARQGSMFAIIKITSLPSNCVWFKYDNISQGNQVSGAFGMGYGSGNADVAGTQFISIDENLQWIQSGVTLSAGSGIFGISDAGITRTFTYNGVVTTVYSGQEMVPAKSGIAMGGTPYATARFSNDTFGEVLGYNRILNNVERQKIEGYLAWKWGLNNLLPTAHPYFSAAP